MTLILNPYYNYGNVVWATNGSTVLQNLLITQKKAIRIITGSSWNAQTKPLFAKLKILTVHELQVTSYNELQVSCFMF